FGQEQERQAGAGDLVLHLGSPDAVPGALSFGQERCAFAIPVVIAEEAMSREPSCSFQTVQVIERPAVASRVVLDTEMAGEPKSSCVDGVLGRVFFLTTAIDCSVRTDIVIILQHGTGDAQGGDAGDGHAPG